VLGFVTTLTHSRLHSEPLWLFGSRGYVALAYGGLAVSLCAQALLWPVLVSKLFLLGYREQAWVHDVHMLVLASLYPLQDGANCWALYWAHRRGKVRLSPASPYRSRHKTNCGARARAGLGPGSRWR
jgi:hypothetical protein